MSQKFRSAGHNLSMRGPRKSSITCLILGVRIPHSQALLSQVPADVDEQRETHIHTYCMYARLLTHKRIAHHSDQVSRSRTVRIGFT